MMDHHLTIYYNTRCPVCDAGIDWQRNKLLAAVRAGHIALKDINEQPDALAAYGASVDDVRRRLHATDELGRLIVGADVAIAMWRVTPGEGWLASLFGNPVLLPVTRLSTTGLRTCCSPGTGARGTGEGDRARLHQKSYFFFAPTRSMRLMASGARPDFSAISRSCSMM